ncbi:xanthine phosphoribosyltransferase [Selenomonas sp. GACV-9]|uniref:xanthine phosphoribosyltransferase n=1 Tax=Selenomonas sp. GACV-9 TaxID=3158782 RepID=UPI0008E9FE6D|nr:xanthine phosphoribosyltransferase [Selenomonas ruminantium]
MELLERKIQEEGIALPGNVLKVDSFLNHQIDPELSLAMGKEFARLFREAGIDRVLTVEASGIAIGVMAALELGVPLVFARKKKSVLINEPVYSQEVFSFTKKETSEIIVLQKYLPAGENVLIIDDFLANGEAALGLASIVETAGSKVAGIGIAIEKAFQPGHQRIIDKGYHLEALASIASLADGKITFTEK